jgi:hypothetical protein
MLLLFALAAEPCSVSVVRKLWSKKPGSESRLFAFERNGRVGFIDPNGKVVVDPAIIAPIEDVGDFSNGLARVDHQGYVDEAGRFVIKQDFWWEYDFSDGLAQVLVEDQSQKYGQMGLVVDPTGKIVARVPAFRTREFSKGLAAYEAEGKPGVRKFEPGNFVYRDYPGRKGFVDRTGNVVVKAEFAEVGTFVDGLARAVLDGYCHIATRDGGREGTPTTGYPSDCGGAPADAVSPCKVGFIKTDGGFAIQPRFEAAQDFQEELAAVRISGLWGFIDVNGTLVIPARFEQVQSFREGLAAVKIDEKWGFIDRTGILTILPRFEAVEAFSDSLAIAYVRGRSFYIDRRGRTEIAGPFLEATPFVHGLAAVLLSDKHVAYIDHAGKTVFDYFRR